MKLSTGSLPCPPYPFTPMKHLRNLRIEIVLIATVMGKNSCIEMGRLIQQWRYEPYISFLVTNGICAAVSSIDRCDAEGESPL